MTKPAPDFKVEALLNGTEFGEVKLSDYRGKVSRPVASGGRTAHSRAASSFNHSHPSHCLFIPL